MNRKRTKSSRRYTGSKIRAFRFVVSFFISLFIGICYINWRAFSTINYHDGRFALVWSYFLLLGEFYTFMIFTSFSLALIRKDQNPTRSDNDEWKDKVLTRYPSVDIFVCTYNESLEIVSDTLIGCLNIDYPNKQVYVLDDGRRPEFEEFAHNIGCNYITRHNNEGFKAGNINNALKQTSGELILIFDADHVPVTTFLNELVHHFEDDDVALIQSPQHFFNPDPFQKNLSLQKHISNEQDLFYRVLEPGLASYGAAVCCGTNFVVRRSCIEEVGGLPEDTVTEDSALGMMLESKGYEILYYNKPLAAGRAPETFGEYMKQRSRWAKGNIQIFANLKNFKYILRLNPLQLYFYFSGMLYFLYSFPRMIFLLSPVLFLLFDVMPVDVVVYQVVIFQFVYFVLKLIFSLTTCGKYRHAMITDVYESATAMFVSLDIIKLFLVPSRINKQAFAVTKKGGDDEGRVELKYFIPILLMTLLLVVASIKGIYDIYVGSPNSGAIGINIFWNTYNLIVMMYAVRVVVEKPELRKHIRIPTSINTKLVNAKNEEISIDLSNLSKGGALLRISGQDIDINEFEEFLKERQFLKLPDNTLAEIHIVNGFVRDKEIFFQAKFAFDSAVDTDAKNRLSVYRKLVGFMYRDSYAWD